ncbi:MAG: TolC family protein [Saprospiraceae bacterium]|nr:TolC family protein [Candidatus Vicinibacter affinis]MBK7695814.1 TolC family protein [Candidatus Vicinibacter affinis]MBK8405723.1 TolC family protein [Candidatus Vicinibacter affinis]MBK8643122.1 TolC family protein [Candidatus Vicinibacter affinis]
MKKKSILILSLLACFNLFGQSGNEFNLEQAINYARLNSSTLNIQKLEIRDAKDQILEYKSIGIPKLNASVGYNHFINIPTSILPDFISPAVYGVLFDENVLPRRDINYGSGFPAQFGLKNSLTAGVQLSTLIFDGSFLVGLKAQKLYSDLIQLQVNQTEADLRYRVTKAYMGALSIKENLTILDKNIENLEKVYKEVNEIYKVGFSEKLDVDRIELSLQTLKTEREKLARLDGITQNVLKFQMNYPLDKDLVQTESFKQILDKSYLEIMDPSFKLNTQLRPEYPVIAKGLELTEINIRRLKASYLPSLSGFVSHQEVLQRNNLFDNAENSWFPTTIAGLNLNIPIFDGLDRKAKINRAKTQNEKTKMQFAEFERGVDLEFQNAKTQYINALATLESRKKSLDLADRIYLTTKTKFKEGVGSSLEITQAERDLYSAQANVLEAQYNLIQSKVDLDKALGKI